jgi:hypothetical protein
MGVLRYILILAVAVVPISAFSADKGGGVCDTCADTNWSSCTAADTAYATVAACVANANAEATITLPAGTSDWTGSTLSITKGVKLIGAGVTTIIQNTGSTRVINYTPASGNWSANYNFRISGIKFDLSTAGVGMYLNCGPATTAQTKVRIDTNTFYNSTASGSAIVNYGCRGVIDHNSFDTLAYPLRVGFGSLTSSGQFQWDTFGQYTFGTADNIYVEDNTVTGTGSEVISALTDGDMGGQYVVRYNSITLAGQLQPAFDMHGDHSPIQGTRGAEVYGNQITGEYDTRLMSQRGGRLVSFLNNDINASKTFQIYLYNNSECPTATHEINSSYYWGNRKNLTGTVIDAAVLTNSGCEADPITEGTDYWDDTTASGVRYGTLAAIPATCTTGMGYWATAQSTSDLTGLVGASPATPISGTLYKCTAEDTWTSYYTPYTYPHPLTDTTAPTVTAFTLPATSSSLTVTISTFTIDEAASLYCIQPTNSSTGCSWTASAPTTYPFGTSGAKTLYAFAKDAAGNISTNTATHEVDTDGTTITLVNATGTAVRTAGTNAVYGSGSNAVRQ